MHKVLFVIASLNRGGTELRLLDTLRGLDNNKFETLLFVAKDGGELLNEIANTKVITGKSANSVVRSLPTLWKYIGNEKPHIIWCLQTGVISFAAQLFAYVQGVPAIILSIHGKHPDRLSIGLLNRLIVRWIPDRVVTVSNDLRKLLLQEGVPERLITVLYNGVNTTVFTPLADRASLKAKYFNVDPKCKVIGQVGNLLPVKAYDVLLRAAEKVVQEYPDVVFVLIGEGIERARLEALCSELKLQKHVRFMGSRSDVSALLQGFDIFTLTSKSEGMPNALLEAMATGLPVVCTRVGGVSEIVTAESGILVSPDDADGLAVALLHLLKSPEKSAAMGQAAHERVINKFSLEAMIQGREELLLKLLSPDYSL